MVGRFAEELGSGPRLVLVHGSGDREVTWADQRPLADRFRLVIPDRRGYGKSGGVDPSFERDAVDIASLLEDGAHLVGFSYGGLGCLLAAANRHEAVRSLTLIEPVVFALAPTHPAVRKIVRRLQSLYQATPYLEPDEFDARFDAALACQEPPDVITKLDDHSRATVKAIMRERPPWHAQIPCQEVSTAPFPRMVVSGGWSPAFEALCDELHRKIGGERVVLEDYGGHGVQHAHTFNELLERFTESA